MSSAIRKRVTPATVIATVALVMAMSGGAYAAGHYLISSTKQISPKVLKALTGKPGATGPAGTSGAQGATGPAGPTGATGPAGAVGAVGETGPAGAAGAPGKEGKAGKEGSPWTAGGTLPSGKTETGAWVVGPIVPQPAKAAISFPIPLAGPLPHGSAHVVNAEDKEYDELGKLVVSAACLGKAELPTAEPGNLCIYLAHVKNAALTESAFVSDPVVLGESTVGRTGAIFPIVPEEAGEEYEADGTWAVTAE